MNDYGMTKNNLFESHITLYNNQMFGSAADGSAVINLTRERLAKDIAEKIVNSPFIRIHEDKWTTEVSARVYVLSPQELAEIVQKEVEKVTYRLRPLYR